MTISFGQYQDADGCWWVGYYVIPDEHEIVAVTEEGQPSHSDNHDYHGPTQDGQPVPDEVHERFHRAIGDVLNGHVIPKAREQMRDALNKPLPAAPRSTTKEKPLPRGAIGLQRQEVGIKLP